MQAVQAGDVAGQAIARERNRVDETAFKNWMQEQELRQAAQRAMAQQQQQQAAQQALQDYRMREAAVREAQAKVGAQQAQTAALRAAEYERHNQAMEVTKAPTELQLQREQRLQGTAQRMSDRQSSMLSPLDSRDYTANATQIALKRKEITEFLQTNPQLRTKEKYDIAARTNNELSDLIAAQAKIKAKYEKPSYSSAIMEPGSPAAGTNAPTKTAGRTVRIPIAASEYLKKHPELSKEFDAKYGEGIAKQVLAEE